MGGSKGSLRWARGEQVMAKSERMRKTIEGEHLLAALESFELDVPSIEHYQPHVFKQLGRLKRSLKRETSRLTRKDWERQLELMNGTD